MTLKVHLQLTTWTILICNISLFEYLWVTQSLSQYTIETKKNYQQEHSKDSQELLNSDILKVIGSWTAALSPLCQYE